MKTLKARLSEKLCNAYLLEGDDLFLFDKAFSMIKKACNLSMEDFKEAMKDVYTTSVVESTLDESPAAYKPAQEIIEAVKDTIDIVDIIKIKINDYFKSLICFIVKPVILLITSKSIFSSNIFFALSILVFSIPSNSPCCLPRLRP